MFHYRSVRYRISGRLLAPSKLRIEPERIPQAAVTLLIRESPTDDEVLIIRRAERAGDPWSGHLALPGGRAEAGDDDLLATAARETFEEVGVDLLGPSVTREKFIGQLPALVPVSPGVPRIEITPLVAVAPPEPQIRLNPEVGEAWWVSINELHHNGRSSEYRLCQSGQVLKWPAYNSPGGPIWGITERILTNFIALLG
ncbi:MAG: CoA pyrophosphatase [Acidobacteria bacterium]|nr:CoA pyrophosphatase [Acidobacteriota bacterium]